MRRYTSIVLAVLFGSALVALAPAPQPTPNRVDEVRGRWDFTIDLDGTGNRVTETLFINDISPSADTEDKFVAAGCIQLTKGSSPLAVQLNQHSDGTYTMNLVGTFIVPTEDGEPFVASLTGIFLPHGNGVSDDEASGTVESRHGTGSWSARHHDRRRHTCPGVEVPELFFFADLYVARAVNGDAFDLTIFEGFTNIVSSGMRVRTPDGRTITVGQFTDIFSPGVDFSTFFRYLSEEFATPIPQGEYTFTLLDPLGSPIAGTQRTDVWLGCTQGAPQDVTGTYVFEQHVDLAWDPVPPAPGFDPAADPPLGFYQIEIGPLDPDITSTYGAGGILTTSHRIPWADFPQGSPGHPDGSDFGDALEEFADGRYSISVVAFAEVPPGSPGVGLECQIRDLSETLIMDKQGSDISLGVVP